MSKNKVSIIHSSSKFVSCNGSTDHSNHPTVYLNLTQRLEAVCPYCSIQYIYKNTEDTISKT